MRRWPHFESGRDHRRGVCGNRNSEEARHELAQDCQRGWMRGEYGAKSPGGGRSAEIHAGKGHGDQAVPVWGLLAGTPDSRAPGLDTGDGAHARDRRTGLHREPQPATSLHARTQADVARGSRRTIRDGAGRTDAGGWEGATFTPLASLSILRKRGTGRLPHHCLVLKTMPLHANATPLRQFGLQVAFQLVKGDGLAID